MRGTIGDKRWRPLRNMYEVTWTELNGVGSMVGGGSGCGGGHGEMKMETILLEQQ